MSLLPPASVKHLLTRRGFLGRLAGASLLPPPAAELATGAFGALASLASRSRRGADESKYLVLDGRLHERLQNLRRALGKVEKSARNPLFVEDKPWEVRFDNLYANVLFDPARQRYRCWYNSFIVDEVTANTPPAEWKRVPYGYKPKTREMGLCYAESPDGLVWTKPDLGLVEFRGSKNNNLVMRNIHGVGVWEDRQDADPSRRFKAFMTGGVAWSPDGLRWTERLPCPEIQAEGDTHNNAFWDAPRSRYVGFTRLWAGGQRLVGRTESADYRRWTQAVAVLRGSPDAPHRQTYALLVFPCANVYLGLLMLLDTQQDVVDCELAWSPDTVRWERVCPGTPLIPRGPPGSWDWGCIYAAAYPLRRGGAWRLYYGGSDGPHTGFRAGGLGLATLRPDGFAGLEPAEPATRGSLLTPPLECSGTHLTVSADAAGGAVRVAVRAADGPPVRGLDLESCVPVTANVTDGRVRWRGGRSLAGLQGRLVRLEFELRAARLYAFAFGSDAGTRGRLDAS